MHPTDDVLKNIVFHKRGIRIDGSHTTDAFTGNSNYHDAGGGICTDTYFSGDGFQFTPICIFGVEQVDNPAFNNAPLVDNRIAAAGFFN